MIPRVLRHLRGALRVAWRAFLRFQDHHGPDRAAAVAYYTLLSLVPLLIFLISLGVAVLGSFDAAYQGTMLLVSGVVIHLSPASMDTLRTFVEHEVPFTIATDGPEMMRTHLRDELELLLRIEALDEDELREANARGHAAAFRRGIGVAAHA